MLKPPGATQQLLAPGAVNQGRGDRLSPSQSNLDRYQEIDETLDEHPKSISESSRGPLQKPVKNRDTSLSNLDGKAGAR